MSTDTSDIKKHNKIKKHKLERNQDSTLRRTGNAGDTPASQGVDQLIERLRQEGVNAGQAEADKLIREANQQAQQILDKANRQAQQRLEEARKEANALISGGQEALRTAMRDMILGMKSELMQNFNADIERMIAHEMAQPETLRQIILEIAGKVREETIGDQVELILPANIVSHDELRNNPQSLAQDPLTELVFGITRCMLEEGINLSISSEIEHGIHIKLQGQQATLEFTEETVLAVLLSHLQPRFRAVLEGVVR